MSRLYYYTVLYFVVGLDIIGSHAGTQICMMEKKKCGHLAASLTMMQASFKNQVQVLFRGPESEELVPTGR